MAPLEELEQAYAAARADGSFQTELDESAAQFRRSSYAAAVCFASDGAIWAARAFTSSAKICCTLARTK